jgi:maleylpyruvate isomerase
MTDSPAHPLDTELEPTLAQVDAASARYLATVDGLSEADFAAASVLPGWSVAHVISHVASNATGITRAIDAAIAGDPVPWVYETNAGRDAEIDERAAWPSARLADLNRQSVTDLKTSLAGVTDQWEVLLPRVIDGPAWSILDWVGARWREVEIHHTDMGVGYTHHDWDDAFVDYLTSVAAFDREPEVALTLRSPDGDVEVGGGGQVVSGSRRDLVWWLIGRGGGAGVASESPLPTLGPWQRRTRV